MLLLPIHLTREPTYSRYCTNVQPSAGMFQAKYKALKQEITVDEGLDDVEKRSFVHLTTQKHSYLTWFMGFMLVASILLNMAHYIPLSSWTNERQHDKTYSE